MRKKKLIVHKSLAAVQ